MKKSEIKLISLVLLSSFILLLNIFIKNILTGYTLIVFLGIIFGISYYLVGFEKTRIQNKKDVLGFVTIYSFAFLILLYGIGLFTGYLRNSYSLSPLMILKNTVPVILTIIISEVLRSNLCRKGENNKLILISIIVLFTLVDMVLSIHLYDIKSLGGILGILTVTMIPSIFKNLLLNDLSLKFGYLPGIIYSLIFGLYFYIMPIVPNLNDYMTSTVMFLIPLALMILVDKRFASEEEEEEDLRDKKYINKAINGVLIAIMAIMIALFSNLFPVWIAAVGSGSMEPTIMIGDAIIVDKTVAKDPNKLTVGDVLVFKIKDTIYTHRIIEIKEINGKKAMITKGDREGQAVDTWVVTNENIIGRVKFKIPYVGWPTVWLSRMVG